MRKLPLPSSGVNDVLALCAAHTRHDLRARLESVAPAIAAAERAFLAAAAASTLSLFPTSNEVAHGTSTVSDKEMEHLYSAHFARATGAGRPIYDQIRLSAPFGVCPLCGLGMVASVDHHLPKSAFVSLVVTPANLVPACGDCNHTKGSLVPGYTETLHPYFDDPQDFDWLTALIVSGPEPAVRYAVAVADNVSPDIVRKLTSHFDRLRLAERYSACAAQRLTFLAERLKSFPDKSARRAFLLDEARAHLVLGKRNSWERVMFATLGDDDWYCDTGWKF